MKEKVLCIKKKSLPSKWIKQETIIKINQNIFYDICSKAGFYWIEKDKAEIDPLYKQIIPYIIIQTKEKTGIYKRKGNEKRLHNLWSIGIGGHINPQDESDKSDKSNKSGDFKDILTNGMLRELNEEFSIIPKIEVPVFCGIINDEKTDVGKVHMGAVFKIITNQPLQFKPDKELVDFYWKDTKTLNNVNLELWSKLSLKLLKL
ncbi:MAG: phosphoesterase [Desulfobacteraceae bacterium 4572_130]|nr:MAG: phosphoesterase [Desulfobacteraceae bacterium 4572_130]